MDYARVKNGQVVQVGLPVTGILADGCTVSGYNLLDTETLRAEGWLPLEDNQPEYDTETEYLELAGYTVQEDKVIANYTIRQRQTPLPTLEQQIADIQIALAELYGMGV